MLSAACLSRSPDQSVIHTGVLCITEASGSSTSAASRRNSFDRHIAHKVLLFLIYVALLSLGVKLVMLLFFNRDISDTDCVVRNRCQPSRSDRPARLIFLCRGVYDRRVGRGGGSRSPCGTKRRTGGVRRTATGLSPGLEASHLW